MSTSVIYKDDREKVKAFKIILKRLRKFNKRKSTVNFDFFWR